MARSTGEISVDVKQKWIGFLNCKKVLKACFLKNGLGQGLSGENRETILAVPVMEGTELVPRLGTSPDFLYTFPFSG